MTKEDREILIDNLGDVFETLVVDAMKKARRNFLRAVDVEEFRTAFEERATKLINDWDECKSPAT